MWFYYPSISFPKDKIEPRCFLDLVDNTGDDFSYEILPVSSYKNIPSRRNPVTLVQSVVRPRSLVTSDGVPRCVESSHGFKFFNRNGDDFFGAGEVKTNTPVPKAPIPKNYSAIKCNNILSARSSSQDTMAAEHDIDGSMSLSSMLCVEGEQQS